MFACNEIRISHLDFATGNNQWEIWISLQVPINGKFGFRYRQQLMGNLDFVTGNNQWEIRISLQATINEKFGFRYRQQSMGNLDFATGNNPLIVACSEIQISH
jgi:putative salt-induced outer membrane protein YdiY